MQKLDNLEDNILVKEYEKYLNLNYSNEITKKNYLILHKRFLRDVAKKLKIQPENIRELKQDFLDWYIIKLNSTKKANPIYIAYLKSFLRCFDPDNIKFKVNLKLDRSHKRVDISQKHNYLLEEQAKILIDKSSPYISMVVSVLWSSGLRASELIYFDLSNKENSLDLKNGSIVFIGKSNKRATAYLSPEACKKIYEYYNSGYCINPEKPFMIYTQREAEHKDPTGMLRYILKQNAKILGIKLQDREIFTHSVRHGYGMNLVNHGFNIMEIKEAMRHADLKSTQAYVKIEAEKVRDKIAQTIFQDTTRANSSQSKALSL